MVITTNMEKILRNESDLIDLLTFWGIDKKYIHPVNSWFRKLGTMNYNTKIISLDYLINEMNYYPDSENLINFKNYLLTSLHSNFSSLKESTIQFIQEEICLSIYTQHPILCTETASWKVVDILKKIGAHIKKEVILHGEQKSKLPMQKDFWKKPWLLH